MLTAIEAMLQTEQAISADLSDARKIFDDLLESGDEDALWVLSAITTAIQKGEFRTSVHIGLSQEKLIIKALRANHYKITIVNRSNEGLFIQIGWQLDA